MNFLTTSLVGGAHPYFELLGSIRARKVGLRQEWEFASQASYRCVARAFFARECAAALAVLDRLENRLDKSSFIDHNVSDGEQLDEGPKAIRAQAAVIREVRKEFRGLGTSTEQKDRIFGLPKRDSAAMPVWLRSVMDKLKIKGGYARMSEQKWRMIEEITLRAEQGWYIVFNTLTVDNTNYDKVFEKGSMAWRDYVRGIERVIGSEIYGNIRDADAAKRTSPFHSYFGVVERGKLHGRLHIHVIHCLKTIPGRWKGDPNACVGPPKNRQIVGMKVFWPHGHSQPIACRFSDHDAFGRIGWCWPVRRRGGRWEPIPTKPPIAIARYMCKYLLKAFSSDKGKYQWRTRISNGFGLFRMRETISGISRESLWEFVKGPPVKIRIRDWTLPTSRVRLECLRSLLKLRRSGHPESVESLLLLRTIRKSLKMVTPRPPIAEHLRSLKSGTTTFNWRNITTFVVQTTKDTGGFDVREAFERAYERPVQRFKAVGGTPRC